MGAERPLEVTVRGHEQGAATIGVDVTLGVAVGDQSRCRSNRAAPVEGVSAFDGNPAAAAIAAPGVLEVATVGENRSRADHRAAGDVDAAARTRPCFGDVTGATDRGDRAVVGQGSAHDEADQAAARTAGAGTIEIDAARTARLVRRIGGAVRHAPVKACTPVISAPPAVAATTTAAAAADAIATASSRPITARRRAADVRQAGVGRNPFIAGGVRIDLAIGLHSQVGADNVNTAIGHPLPRRVRDHSAVRTVLDHRPAPDRHIRRIKDDADAGRIIGEYQLRRVRDHQRTEHGGVIAQNHRCRSVTNHHIITGLRIGRTRIPITCRKPVAICTGTRPYPRYRQGVQRSPQQCR